jgi:hypothetical protein
MNDLIQKNVIDGICRVKTKCQLRIHNLFMLKFFFKEIIQPGS